MNKEHTEIKLPRRVVDISALAEECAEPEDALLLLSVTTNEALAELPDSARLEVRDLIYELGRVAHNAAFPIIRVDLDLELEPPNDWCAAVLVQGYEMRSFSHTTAEGAFALGVREAVLQATAMGIRSRSEMVGMWSIALGCTCEVLDELAGDLRIAEKVRDDVRKAEHHRRQVELELNPESDDDERR